MNRTDSEICGRNKNTMEKGTTILEQQAGTNACSRQSPTLAVSFKHKIFGERTYSKVGDAVTLQIDVPQRLVLVHSTLNRSLNDRWRKFTRRNKQRLAYDLVDFSHKSLL